MRTHNTASAILLSLALLACAPTSTDILQPRWTAEPNVEGNRSDLRRIEYAVRSGLTGKGWITTRQEPGAIYATASSGGHEATVRIQFDANGWEIQYVSSSPGLKYDPDYFGREIIHYRYNMWVRTLNRSIQQALLDQQRQALDSAEGAARQGAPH